MPICAPQADAMRAQWEAERQALKKVQALREEIERVRHEADQAERAYDLERGRRAALRPLAELERRLAAEEQQLAAKQGGTRLLREVVTEEEIAVDRVALDGHPGQPAPGGRAARSCCGSTRSSTSA